MKNSRSVIRWSAIVIAAVALSLLRFGIGAGGSQRLSSHNTEGRADILSLDSLKAFGALERPAVIFLHQKHTAVLEKRNKDCTSCHLPEENRLSLKYMRHKDTTKTEVMDIYHTHCIACHRETAAAKEKSGPIVCGECHRPQPAVVSSWQPIGMNKSLHFRHSKAQNNKCEMCHHEYNDVTKKLFYAEGKEGTCRYCHKEETEDNRISFRQASHIACIACHRKKLTHSENAGPIMCGGCHEAGQQRLIEVVEDVPRIKRNQPDTVFVKTSTPEKDNAAGIPPVPFNHKAHESYNDTCRVCHHADLNGCVKCHTRQGAKEGDYVTLEQSMHRLNLEQSCLGCHNMQQSDRRCAGCHAFFSKKRPQDQQSCRNCHMAVNNPDAGQSDEKMLAAMQLESREIMRSTYDDADIPEHVTIDTLVNRYEPVKLPHLKIVTTLFAAIKDSKLAGYFHREKGTLCQGCHHNSPAAKKPPTCASCHGKPFDISDPFRPGLMAAYHRQCMECHREMGIQKPVSTNCTACHREKN